MHRQIKVQNYKLVDVIDDLDRSTMLRNWRWKVKIIEL